MGSLDYNDFYDFYDAIKNKIELDPEHKNIGKLSKVYDDYIDLELINLPIFMPESMPYSFYWNIVIRIDRFGTIIMEQKGEGDKYYLRMYTLNLYEFDYDLISNLNVTYIPCIQCYTNGTYSYVLARTDCIKDDAHGRIIIMFNGETKIYDSLEPPIILCNDVPDPFFVPPK